LPIYEYRCAACDHLAEVIHGINDPGPRFCESCGSEGRMRKGVGMPAVLYKGSGWARKDRPSRPSSSGARSDKSSDGSEGATSRGDGSGTKAETDRAGAGSGSGSSAESGSRSGTSGSSSSVDD
jgi:putative FmdB family regulatory protein